MSAINWDLVDGDVFAEFRYATAEQIAEAYVAEAYSDKPNDTRLVTLYEIGQGGFSERWNNRAQREALFATWCSRVVAEREATKVGA